MNNYWFIPFYDRLGVRFGSCAGARAQLVNCTFWRQLTGWRRTGWPVVSVQAISQAERGLAVCDFCVNYIDQRFVANACVTISDKGFLWSRCLLTVNGWVEVIFSNLVHRVSYGIDPPLTEFKGRNSFSLICLMTLCGAHVALRNRDGVAEQLCDFKERSGSELYLTVYHGGVVLYNLTDFWTSKIASCHRRST